MFYFVSTRWLNGRLTVKKDAAADDDDDDDDNDDSKLM
jgi:hypothetical protein